MNARVTTHSAPTSSHIYSNCTAKTVYEPEYADLDGRKPEGVKLACCFKVKRSLSCLPLLPQSDCTICLSHLRVEPQCKAVT